MSRINDIRFRVFLKFPLPFYMKEGGGLLFGDTALIHFLFSLKPIPITGYKIFFRCLKNKKFLTCIPTGY